MLTQCQVDHWRISHKFLCPKRPGGGGIEALTARIGGRWGLENMVRRATREDAARRLTRLLPTLTRKWRSRRPCGSAGRSAERASKKCCVSWTTSDS